MEQYIILLFAILFVVIAFLPNNSFRILETEDGMFFIQQRHFIFRWWWVEPWVNMIGGVNYPNMLHKTIEEAEGEVKSLTKKPKYKIVKKF